MSLIVRGRESRKIQIVLEFEGSVTVSSLTSGVIAPQQKIERLRDSSGQWIKAGTVMHRLQNMGAKLVAIEPKGPGEHTPSY